MKQNDDFIEKVCPVCGNVFFPTPDLAYKAYVGGKDKKNVCYYHCVLDSEKKNFSKDFPSEDEEQIALMVWANYMSREKPELKLLHHIPNGGKRSVTEAARFKAMGVKSGVSDLFLPVARKGHHGLYIEMKRVGGRVQESQKKWLSDVTDQGYLGVVCFGWIEAKKVLEDYLA